MSSHLCFTAQLQYLLFQDNFYNHPGKRNTFSLGSLNTLFMLLSSQLHQLLTLLIGRWG